MLPITRCICNNEFTNPLLQFQKLKEGMCQSQTSPSSPSLRGTSFREKPNIPLRYTLMTKKNFVSFRGGFSCEEACTIYTVYHTNVNLHHHYHHLILHTPAQSSQSSAPVIRPLVCKSSDHPLSRCQDLRLSIFLHTQEVISIIRGCYQTFSL